MYLFLVVVLVRDKTTCPQIQEANCTTIHFGLGVEVKIEQAYILKPKL